MRANQCHVVSRPALPSVYDHPLWDAWDYTLDLCLSQMYESTFPTNKLWALGKEIYFTRSSMRYNSKLFKIRCLLISGGRKRKEKARSLCLLREAFSGSFIDLLPRVEAFRD